MNQPTYIDSHCHLYFDKFDGDRADVVARAKEAGFEAIINIGIDQDTSMKSLELTQEFPEICYAVVGLHPCEAKLAELVLNEYIEWLRLQIKAHPKKIVGIGETGIDYYWDSAPPELQKLAFRAQMQLAMECDLPIVIHCRNSQEDDQAMQDCLKIVAEFPSVGGVFHCFGGNAESAKQALELGWHISFAGNLSYPKALDLHQAAKLVPAERLLLETDAPFLAPQAKRGKRNEPAFAVHTLEALAKHKKMDATELANITSLNSRRLFRLQA